MLLLVLLFLALLIGGLLGSLMLRDTGYVMFNYGPWVMETSLWVFLIGLAVVYVAWRLLIVTIRYLAGSQGRLLQWRSTRNLRRARERTIRGVLLLAEGRWADAKGLFLEGVKDIETPFMNYLNAARAAHELGAHDERDALLKQAQDAAPGARFASLITQAEYHLHDGDHAAALEILLLLRDRAPKQPAVQRLLAKCYEAQQDWDALHELLKDLAQSKALPPLEMQRLSKLVWHDMLLADTAAAATWKRLPANLREDNELLSAWVQSLVERDLEAQAEQALRLIIEQRWQPEFVTWFGRVAGADPKKQLAVAQEWARSHKEDVDLELTIGRLQLRNAGFEQARERFEAALKIEPREEIYAELGRLCVALGDERRGADYLLKSVASLPELPQPSAPLIRQTQPI